MGDFDVFTQKISRITDQSDAIECAVVDGERMPNETVALTIHFRLYLADLPLSCIVSISDNLAVFSRETDVDRRV